MTHAPNRKYLPPLRSAAEYERKIEELLQRVDYLVALVEAEVPPQRRPDDLRKHLEKTG